MRHWTSTTRRRHGHRPVRRIDSRRPLGQPKQVPEGKDWQRLGRLMLQKRAELGLSQGQVAELMNVTTKTVRTLEKGRPVASSTVARVDSALNLEPGTALATLHGDVQEDPGVPPPPGLDALGSVPSELVYFGERLKDRPEDLPRLLRLLETYHQMKLRLEPPLTPGDHSTVAG